MINVMKPNQDGFTLVELLMAMAVFSFMLSIIMVGFLGVVRVHEAGVVQRNTQQNARLAMDQVIKAIQQAADGGVMSPPTQIADATHSQIDAVCLQSNSQNVLIMATPVTIGGNTFYQLDLKTMQSPTCMGTVISTTHLTNSTVGITQFKITVLPAQLASQGAVSVKLTVASAYGITELDGTKQLTTCKPGTDKQFCAVTTLSSTAGLKGTTQLQ